MTIARRIKHAFRGRVSSRAALFEIGRRGCVALRSRYERSVQSFEGAGVGRIRLSNEFANLPGPKLLEHFRFRSTPRFFSGFEVAPEKLSELHRQEFPAETSALLDKARRIVTDHHWPLLVSVNCVSEKRLTGCAILSQALSGFLTVTRYCAH